VKDWLKHNKILSPLRKGQSDSSLNTIAVWLRSSVVSVLNSLTTIMRASPSFSGYQIFAALVPREIRGTGGILALSPFSNSESAVPAKQNPLAFRGRGVVRGSCTFTFINTRQGSIAKRWSRRTGATVEGRIESRGVELIYPVGGEPGARARSAYIAPAREL
jgi:hypothetical protein